MLYKVAELFNSLKGEGVWTGVPMSFIRMAGCNLKCEKCDTNYSQTASLSEKALAEACSLRRVVITGGEPCIQDLRPLLRLLHKEGHEVHLETNGTQKIPLEVDWIAVSPKTEGAIHPDSIARANEIKFPVSSRKDLVRAEAWRKKAAWIKGVWYLHPWNDNFEKVVGARTELGFSSLASELCIEYALAHPEWRVSLQAHKVWRIP